LRLNREDGDVGRWWTGGGRFAAGGERDQDGSACEEFYGTPSSAPAEVSWT
jgi:hypothetical protein